ncbi:MAG: hypothetical protein ACK4OK_04655 [Thermoflexus sp.]
MEPLQECVRQLEALNRALEQALVAREQMIQNVSHQVLPSRRGHRCLPPGTGERSMPSGPR